jgi:cobyrinic acid a,c-diamide synthase
MNAFIVAGTHSGVGKTTVAAGLLAAFARRGHRVQAFKAGPDYIDPSHLAGASGAPSRNLDLWLCGASEVRRIFARTAAAVNVIEGMMGLFDGAPDGRGSTAELAKALGVPVVLVVDAHALAQSAGAVAHGFATYDPAVRLAGVIFNRVASAGHYAYLRRAVRVPSLGWLAPGTPMPERHLGLVPAAERRSEPASVEHVDLDRLLRLTKVPAPGGADPPPAGPPVARIGVARDEAFCFYYEDNLDRLREAGAEVVPFSPLRRELPEVDAVYLGGGFPEAHRVPAHPRLRDAVRSGMPVYAECGGLMYLVGQGLLPGRIEMTGRLQDFGYVRARAERDTVVLARGRGVRGHEFHYSRWVRPAVPAAYRVGPRAEGYARRNIHASYVHLHFGGAPECAVRLVQSACRWGGKRP